MNMSNLLLNRSGTRHKAEVLPKTKFTFNNVKKSFKEICYAFQLGQMDDFIELVKLRYINSLIKSIQVHRAEYLIRNLKIKTLTYEDHQFM